MLQLSQEFKRKAVSALLNARENYDGSDSAFAKKWGINASIFSRLKNGDNPEGLLRQTHYLIIGRELGINPNEQKWNMARTQVFNMIEDDLTFCQQNAKAMICVDDCGIGKTYSAKYLARTMKNCFYVDASQAKTRQLFIRLVAKTVGVEPVGKYAEVKENLKYYIKMLPNPLIIIDEAGDLQYDAFLELKELWNATEGCCGWYMIGADGLRAKISRGITYKKVGYREMFSRYSESYSSVVPTDRQEKLSFYRQLISDVLTVNMPNKSGLNEIIRRCLTVDENGNIGGLRRAESLLKLSTSAA